MALTIGIPAVDPVVLGTGRTAIVTVANTTGCFYVCAALTLCNTSASAATFTIYRDDGTSSDGETLYKAVNLAAGQTVTLPLISVPQNRVLSGLASAGSSMSRCPMTGGGR